jgi:hypothetical protein
LENLERAGFDATALVQSAAAKGPLPDDHPAAALWWRILDELATAAAKRFSPANAGSGQIERYEIWTGTISTTANESFNADSEPPNSWARIPTTLSGLTAALRTRRNLGPATSSAGSQSWPPAPRMIASAGSKA